MLSRLQPSLQKTTFSKQTYSLQQPAKEFTGEVMRITGGTMKGRRLARVIGPDIRPTSDLVRGSIFNILGQDLSGSTILDLFAGTGSFGIEALSRGAQKALFIDRSNSAVSIIKRNISTCACEAISDVLQGELPKALNHVKNLNYTKFDLVFMDPPYNTGYIEPTIAKIIENDLLKSEAVVVVESSTKSDNQLPLNLLSLLLERSKSYGTTLVGFYTNY